MKVMCECRHCGTIYDEHKARGEYKGFCSAKCQHETARRLGYRKANAKLGGSSEYSVLKKWGAIGSVFVVQVNGKWQEITDKKPDKEQLTCPDCGKVTGWYWSITERKHMLQLHDTPADTECRGNRWAVLAILKEKIEADQAEDAEDEAKRPARTKLREDFRSYVLRHLTEYIKEAEHQDGEGYWDRFPTVKEAVEDFAIYLKELEGE